MRYLALLIRYATFALAVFHTGLQRGRINAAGDKLHAEMLDPYVPLLLRLLESSRENKVPRARIVTRLPRRANACASSRATTDDPITARRAGMDLTWC